MIKIRDLKKSFGNKEVLKGVNLDIKKGKTTVILGLSGGGKSTIIKHIVGLLKADSGEILIDNFDITKATKDELFNIRKKIGFLFQSGALFDSMNVFENVAFPLVEHTKLSKLEIEKKVFDRLELVGLKPNEVIKLYPDELSGGMRKRVGLARTTILDPEVILYDEPSSGLDPVTADIISKLILKFQKEFHTTSILISHDLNETFKTGDYICMLFEGKIIEYSKAEEFKNSQNPVVRQFLDGESEGVIKLN